MINRASRRWTSGYNPLPVGRPPRYGRVRPHSPTSPSLEGVMRRTKWNAMAFLFSVALVLAACGQQPGESPDESEPSGSQPVGSEPAATGGEGTGTITNAIDGQLT